MEATCRKTEPVSQMTAWGSWSSELLILTYFYVRNKTLHHFRLCLITVNQRLFGFLLYAAKANPNYINPTQK